MSRAAGTLIVDCYGENSIHRWNTRGNSKSNVSYRSATFTRSADYERVVLWFEHDVTDQLSLIHLLVQ